MSFGPLAYEKITSAVFTTRGVSKELTTVSPKGELIIGEVAGKGRVLLILVTVTSVNMGIQITIDGSPLPFLGLDYIYVDHLAGVCGHEDKTGIGLDLVEYDTGTPIYVVAITLPIEFKESLQVKVISDSSFEESVGGTIWYATP